MVREDTGCTAVVAGSTGLVGSALVRRLSADGRVGRILALTRRPSPAAAPGVEPVVIDFDRLPEVELPCARADLVFCALGTTRRAVPDDETYERVDRHLVVAIGRLALALGARRLLVVSSVGADPDAGSLYLRIKGRMERDLVALGLPGLSIFRPSLLLGHRAESRPLERFAVAVTAPLAALLRGPVGRYRPVSAEAVARAMLLRAHEATAAVERIPSDEIARLGAASAGGG